jgi:hypothetical protein
MPTIQYKSMYSRTLDLKVTEEELAALRGRYSKARTKARKRVSLTAAKIMVNWRQLWSG